MKTRISPWVWFFCFPPYPPCKRNPLRQTGQRQKEVGIVMTNFAFTPDTVQFEVGVPYRLHFTNNGSNDHSFSDSQLFASATIAAEDAGKIHDGTVEVPEGQIVDIRFVATKPGSYRFHCSHFLHASFGMRGTAIVQ